MHSPTAVVQSRLAWRHSKDIDILISKEKTILDRTAREPRILLLGTSDCGKTTLLKQLTILHGGGYTEQDRKMYLQMIMENVFDCALALLTACSSRLDDIGDIKVKTDVQITLEYLKNKSSREITLEIGDTISRIWNDANIRKIYDAVQLQDTAYYFLERARLFSNPAYSATDDDILHLRTPTTTITETVFTIKKVVFHFFDVGGQQKYRKQWAPYFDKMRHLLFVVSLAAYDQFLADDPTINRMHDALDLFGKICHNPLLKHIPVILFLNKKDLFEKKIRTSPISRYFPDYKYGVSYRRGVRFFEKKFREGNEGEEDNKIVSHVTCCTDRQAMQVIIATTLEIMVLRAVKESGIIQ
ncbi:hypothetical protein BASA50_002792 [Batrachochytrium salamandrivorans]|uniref:Uncharacterized protein n=1 Tax=Batrachochytrium salamandrivorans TaxID=1357716 RepID=A0ABQ8FKB9_9FUNG|nr:hypothetical protein BASA61_009571 [Batrachochytrium salamandrivorans]KAH6599767.1 hypothetical protein BASA50_002792 [Batrachochytrium salamandrivorans]KAH9274058.1 hypothetical protein BASA83_003700 [Batrachochytrium salamandrivorans]KAJ1332454.1 hypothetical protein BSLG_008756 [Batrachochytrium salamandrivorans]